VVALKHVGVFGMAMPDILGGPELDPLTQSRNLEAPAMADRAVGWCAMINCDGGYLTTFLDHRGGRAKYRDMLRRYCLGCHNHRPGEAGFGRLSCERTFPTLQRQPAL
jgi:hypothetical protein